MTTNKVPPQLTLRPVFQPIVSLYSGSVCGYEGLIRAVDPQSGELITPYLLFEQAARGGYIPDLDYRCRETIIRAFSSRFSREDDIRLFINVHPQVITDASVPAHLYETATRCGVLPGNIIVEVDECRVESIEKLGEFAAACRRYGFKLALDDFGTFPCNPERIASLRPEVLKIDISLVRVIPENEHATLAVKTLIQLAASTGSLVIAEGVETEQEALHVLDAGCLTIQGFYFSRPADITALPPAAITDRLQGLLDHFNTGSISSRNPLYHRTRLSAQDGTAFPEYAILRP